MIYLSAGVLAFNKESAGGELHEATGSPISAHEAARTMEPERIAGEALAPETEYPFNTMSQDWDAEQIEGFKEYQIPEKYAKEGGYFSTGSPAVHIRCLRKLRCGL